MNLSNPKTEYGKPSTEKFTFLIRCRAIIVNDDKMLVVKHYKEADFFALPGGHMDQGEDPMICVKREVKEEFNIDIDSPTLKYVYKWIGDNGVENVEFIFLISDGDKFKNLENASGTHAFEIFEMKWVGKDDILKVYPSEVLKDFKENNFEFDDIKFITE